LLLMFLMMAILTGVESSVVLICISFMEQPQILAGNSENPIICSTILNCYLK
jgi:hypothetical protein